VRTVEHAIEDGDVVEVLASLGVWAVAELRRGGLHTGEVLGVGDQEPDFSDVDCDRLGAKPLVVTEGAGGVYPSDMTIIGCPTCNARNRVGPIAQGVPRCPRCKSTLPWVIDADDGTFTAETTASVPVVVDFWAAWCGPCRMISPVLEDLAKSHAGHLKVVKVDVDASPGLATRFGAQSIPLLVVIRDGKEVDRVVGALPRAALEQRLAPVLAA
jgi:thioredoxin 2